MRLSYTTPAQYVIPKSGSIRAAKVLYKVLGPTTAAELPGYVDLIPHPLIHFAGIYIRLGSSLTQVRNALLTPMTFPRILKKYPGFPQAEHLYYPRDVCRRLGAALKESNTAYPESMRTMTDLDVGWLQRA